MRTVFFTILAFFLAPIAIADTEPNNTWETALALSQDRTIAGTQSDIDWYVINAAAGNRILIDLTFTHADGNIQLAFFEDGGLAGDPTVPGPIRANSNSSSDHEFIDNDIPGIGTYYIRVSGGAGGDQDNSYTLTWTEIDALPGDDGFEENDSNAAPAAIAESIVNFGSQSDEDWYSIDAAADDTRLLVSLRFNFANDLDLKLYDVGGTELASSTNGVGVNESIDYIAPTMGTYHLSVTGSNSGDGYALNWAGLDSSSTDVFPALDVNDEAPVAIANTVSTQENTAYSFAATDFTFTDSEGDSLVSATITNLSLGGGTLTYSGGTPLNDGDTLTAAQLDTLEYTPPANTTGSPLATFDFKVNDVADLGTVAAQMDIDVTAATTTTSTGGGSSGSISLLGLFALMLIGLARRVHR